MQKRREQEHDEDMVYRSRIDGQERRRISRAKKLLKVVEGRRKN